jgi:hypothetical protein
MVLLGGGIPREQAEARSRLVRLPGRLTAPPARGLPPSRHPRDSDGPACCADQRTHQVPADVGGHERRGGQQYRCCCVHRALDRMKPGQQAAPDEGAGQRRLDRPGQAGRCSEPDGPAPSHRAQQLGSGNDHQQGAPERTAELPLAAPLERRPGRPCCAGGSFPDPAHHGRARSAGGTGCRCCGAIEAQLHVGSPASLAGANWSRRLRPGQLMCHHYVGDGVKVNPLLIWR